MGTRALIRIITKKRSFALYNQFDGSPSNLGVSIVKELLEFLKKFGFEKLCEMFDSLVVIDETNPPTPTKNDIQKLEPWTDLRVSTQSTSDWYCLTRRCQGSLTETIKSGYALSSDFDKVHVSYRYIIDFTYEKLHCECMFDPESAENMILPLTKKGLEEAITKFDPPCSDDE